MAFKISTTGVVDEVVFHDLGSRKFVHPTIDYDLEQEFRIDEISSSQDVQASIDNNYITVKDENDNLIETVEDSTPVSESDLDTRLDFKYVDDETITSTTSIEYLDKLTCDFTPLSSGNYMVSWYCELVNTVVDHKATVRAFDVTNSDELGVLVSERHDIYVGLSGFKVINLLTPITIKLQFKSDSNNNTARVKRARVLIRRL